MKTLSTAVAFALAVMTGTAFAHSGGTDAMGCHTNTATGDYHCHKPRKQASVKPAKAPAANLLASTR